MYSDLCSVRECYDIVHYTAAREHVTPYAAHVYGEIPRWQSFLNLVFHIAHAQCLRKIKNNKTGGSDGLVGELLKYGGEGMVLLLEKLFSVIWCEEVVPRQWREGLIVNLFKKGDREQPGN